jgi:hypothetical protein
VVEHRTSRQLAPPAFPQVHLSGVGMVSLATLDELRDARNTVQANAKHLAWQAVELDRQVEDRFADAGALLVPRRDWWQVPVDLYPWLAEAERLAARILLVDQRLAGFDQVPEARRQHAVPQFGRWLNKLAATKQRARAAAHLRRTLVIIARTAAAAGMAVPDVHPLIEQATELQARAEGLRAALDAASSRLGALDREIYLREEASGRMGFDSLYLAAQFQVHGPPAILSPLQTEADEVAYLATESALARMATGTSDAGRVSNDWVSVAYAEIRRRVGALRNRSASPQGVEPIDSGTLVVSSRRLAFIGGTEWVAVSLDAVIDVNVYTDAIAVSRLGGEEPDFFLVDAPRQVAFYLDWAMSIGQSRTGGRAP